jgi:hypothetical protein
VTGVWAFDLFGAQLRQELNVYSQRDSEYELRQEFDVQPEKYLDFTPDGVSRPRALLTINMVLLTEGNQRLRWWNSSQRTTSQERVLGAH